MSRAVAPTTPAPDEILDASLPARRIPTDPVEDRPSDGIGLCLSGGGFRAMLFHLGVIWRLNDLGYLPKLDRVSSVSGGSITAAALGSCWSELNFDARGVSAEFERLIVQPIRRMGRSTIDIPAVLGGIFTPKSISEFVADAYRRRLFGSRTLQSLPDHPRFVINATNLQSGVLWRFAKPYMRDYRVGEIKSPETQLADAVAASSAFPPILSPSKFRFAESAYTPGSGQDLQRPPFTTRVLLTDGGVYDNLGVEPVIKRYNTILVSDAGGAFGAERRPWTNWLSQTLRVMLVIDNQVRSLRKRNLIDAYLAGRRKGAYWGIRSDISHFGLATALPCPVEATTKLANVPTRLCAIPDLLQERLINWGYAICDAGMRRHVDLTLPRPDGFLYPDAGVG